MSHNETPNIRKQRIIDAAVKVLARKNVQEATVREIAAEAGLTTGAIYYHYKNKDELLYDVMNQSMHFIYKLYEMDETKKNPESLLDALKQEVGIRFSKLDEQRLHVILTSDIVSKNGAMKTKYRDNYNQVIDKVVELYFSTYPAVDYETKQYLAKICIAALDGVALQNSLEVFPQDPNKFLNIFNDFFSESIANYMKKLSTPTS